MRRPFRDTACFQQDDPAWRALLIFVFKKSPNILMHNRVENIPGNTSLLLRVDVFATSMTEAACKLWSHFIAGTAMMLTATE